ncbi:hypothetical protein EPN27_04365 [Patescibacteria group bacterium]|nr:MAG: hypothetical protein EPN27_04365 [Patescibacteria group bacterium]
MERKREHLETPYQETSLDVFQRHITEMYGQTPKDVFCSIYTGQGYAKQRSVSLQYTLDDNTFENTAYNANNQLTTLLHMVLKQNNPLYFSEGEFAERVDKRKGELKEDLLRGLSRVWDLKTLHVFWDRADDTAKQNTPFEQYKKSRQQSIIRKNKETIDKYKDEIQHIEENECRQLFFVQSTANSITMQMNFDSALDSLYYTVVKFLKHHNIRGYGHTPSGTFDSHFAGISNNYTPSYSGSDVYQNLLERDTGYHKSLEQWNEARRKSTQ